MAENVAGAKRQVLGLGLGVRVQGLVVPSNHYSILALSREYGNVTPNYMIYSHSPFSM